MRSHSVSNGHCRRISLEPVRLGRVANRESSVWNDGYCELLTELVQKLRHAIPAGEPPGVLIVVPAIQPPGASKFGVTAYIGKMMVGIDQDQSEQPEGGQGRKRP